MALRLGNYDPKKRFAHLGPVVVQFFHLKMKYLGTIFKAIWKEDGTFEYGNFKCEKERCSRDNVTPDQMKSYDSNREFHESFFTSYLVEAAMTFFGMETAHDNPTKNKIPDFAAPRMPSQEEEAEECDLCGQDADAQFPLNTPEPPSEEEIETRRKAWVYESLGEFIDTYVFPAWATPHRLDEV